MMNFTVKGHNIPLSSGVNLGVQVTDLSDLEALVKFLTEQTRGKQILVDMVNKVITICEQNEDEDPCQNCLSGCDTCPYNEDEDDDDWDEDEDDWDDDDDDDDDEYYDDDEDDECFTIADLIKGLAGLEL